MMLRIDLKYIFDWIPERSRVLDLGCGEGELLYALKTQKNCQGYGIEIDTNRILKSMEKGINVLQGNIENGLDIFNNGQFDVVVLSQTIQAMRNTEGILQEMARVGNQLIVTFPNFGYWRNRIQIGFGGHMPVSESMPYSWYDTPNIHWCTLTDFEKLCQDIDISVEERIVLTKGKSIQHFSNILGSLAVYRLGRVRM
ncbi:MAG: methionine biosynthesis protein MetW [Neisseriaceae bacterium]|nr:MAG: methionine biosynthesis protein MetW [Neisseriaceae bacterium]